MNVDDIRRIAIVGAGLMGSQIGQEFALAGYDVRLHDLTEERLQLAVKNIQADMKRYLDLGLLTREQVAPSLSRIHTTSVFGSAVEDVDVVVEAVFEDLKLKQQVFRALDALCPERTILVSNASGVPPSKLASATQRPDKVIVANYWNPTYLMPLVEMVRSEDTSDETVETIYNLLIRVGKKPAIEQEPGYVGNRLQGALFREAFSIVSQGIATPQDVDTVIKNSFGRRLAFVGPLEYFDTIGWDLILQWYSSMIHDIASSTEVPTVLKEKVEKGELGVKTGKGFYKWTTKSAEVYKDRLAQALMGIRKIHQTMQD